MSVLMVCDVLVVCGVQRVESQQHSLALLYCVAWREVAVVLWHCVILDCALHMTSSWGATLCPLMQQLTVLACRAVLWCAAMCCASTGAALMCATSGA